MRALTALIAVVALLVGPGAAQAARGGDGVGPFCPKRDLQLRAGERLDTSRLIGKTERRAQRIAKRHECTLRVVRRDGISLPVTDDYRPSRINIAVRQGIVKRVLGIF